MKTITKIPIEHVGVRQSPDDENSWEVSVTDGKRAVIFELPKDAFNKIKEQGYLELTSDGPDPEPVLEYPVKANARYEKGFIYAVRADGRLYPLERILAIMTGVPERDIITGAQVHDPIAFVQKLGFEVIILDRRPDDWHDESTVIQ